MKISQNDLERLKDRMQKGELTAAQANVEKVRIQRVEVVTGRIPREVRNSYNAAVKSGHLAHMKKEGKKPEVYFHPTFEYLAVSERNNHERRAIEALARYAGICV